MAARLIVLILSLLWFGNAQAQVFPGLTPTDRVWGRDTTGTGQVEMLSVNGALSFTGSGGLTVTAADILTQLLTVDGTGSGLDADLLDGVSIAGLLQDLNYTDDAATAGLAITESETFTFAGDTAGIDTSGSGNTLTISFDVTEAEANIESAIDTLANLTSVQGFTITYSDPGADAVFGWDDSANSWEALTASEVIAAIGDIALGTNTSGDYVATVADGTGIDGTASGEGSTYTPTLDLTEVNSTTWGSGTFTTMTFNAGATDPVFTFGSDSFAITGAATFTHAGNTVWTAGNDGSGSTLDADLLDGISSAGFLQDFNFTDDASTAGLAITEAETMTFAGDTAGIDTAGSGNTLTISFDVTEAEANIESAIDTLANLTSIQSLTVTLADAGADAFFGWDDSASAYENLTAAEAFAIIDTVDTWLKNVVEDTTPQLGGDLDLLGQSIFDSTMTNEAAFFAIENGFQIAGASNVDRTQFYLYNDGDGTEGVVLTAEHESASPADGDFPFVIEVFAGADLEEVGQIRMELDDGATTTEDTRWRFVTRAAGSDVESLALVGVTSLFPSGAVLDFNAADVTVTHTANTLTITGGITAIDDLSTIGGIVFNVADNNLDQVYAWDDSAGQVIPIPLATITDEAAPAAGDYVLIYGAEGDLRRANWSTLPGAGGGISNVVEDTTPQLGGDLDLNGFAIDGSGDGFPVILLGATEFGGLTILGTDPSATYGPDLSLFRDGGSPADNDQQGHIGFGGRDDEANAVLYGAITSVVYDITNGTEDSGLIFDIFSGGSGLTALTLDGSTGFATLQHGANNFAGLILRNTSAGDGGPYLYTQHQSASPADNDFVGGLSVVSFNDAVQPITDFSLDVQVLDVTDGTEDSAASFSITSGGSSLAALTLGDADGVSSGVLSHVFDVGATDNGGWELVSSSATASGPVFYTYHNSATPAADDQIGFWAANGEDSAGNTQRYGNIIWKIVDPTDGSEDASLTFQPRSGGSALSALTLTGDASTFNRGAAGGAAIRLLEDSDNGSNYAEFIAPASLTANRQCVLQDSGPPIPDSCVGDGTDAGAGGGIGSVVEDTTPQLGGDLDVNLFAIVAVGTDDMSFNLDDTSTSPDFTFSAVGNSAAIGPRLGLYQNSTTPAADDAIGTVQFSGEDSGSGFETYARMRAEIVDPTAASEDGRLEFDVRSAGADLTALTLGTTGGGATGFGTAHVFDGGSSGFPALVMQGSNTDSGGPYLITYHNSSSPAASDNVGGIYFRGEDSASNVQDYTNIDAVITDPTSASEDSSLSFSVQSAGSGLTALTLGGTDSSSQTPSHIFNLGSGGGAVEIKGTSTGAFGAELILSHDPSDDSEAAGDAVGRIFFSGTDSGNGAADNNYATIRGEIVDTTAASEDGRLEFDVLSAGAALTALTLGQNSTTPIDSGSWGVPMVSFDLSSVSYGFEITQSRADAWGPQILTYHNSSSPAAGDDVGGWHVYGEDSAGNTQLYGSIRFEIADTTSTSEDSHVNLDWERAGSFISYSLSGSIAKFWEKNTQSSTTILDSENVPSVADTATGRLTVTIGTDMIDADYVVQVNAEHNSASGTTQTYQIDAGGQAAGTVIVESWQVDGTEALTDPTASWYTVGFGH